MIYFSDLKEKILDFCFNSFQELFLNCKKCNLQLLSYVSIAYLNMTQVQCDMVDRIKYSVMWVLVSILFSDFFFFCFSLIPLSPRRVICRYLFTWFHCAASALDASHALWISAHSRNTLYSCFSSCLPIHWPHKKLSLSQVSRYYEYLSHIRKLSRN